jgi:hypothetical protein
MTQKIGVSLGEHFLVDANQLQILRKTTQLVKRAPPLIPQQLRGIIDAERSQDSLSRDCDRLASMMPRNYCEIKGGARFTNCVIIK